MHPDRSPLAVVLTPPLVSRRSPSWSPTNAAQPRSTTGEMAEAAVGWLVSPIIKIVVDKARCCASDRIKWLSDGVPKTLDRLRSTLIQVQTVARNVERQGCPDGSGSLGAWLQQLKDAIFDADDVLDDFDDSAPQPEPSVVNRLKEVVKKLDDVRVNRLKEVVKKLDDVRASCPLLLAAAEASAPAPAPGSGDSSGHRASQGRATGSVRHQEQPVFGRDKQLREMVSWLVNDQSIHVPVAAIMGHGGMGKTTLAQLLLEDRTVASAFDLKIWIQPKATDNELELATQILQSAGVVVPPGTTSFDLLQRTLQQDVSSRKFLLVVDDVWNREGMQESVHREMWVKVLAPLSNGNKAGSKIVVTTRQKTVAKLLRASKVVWLDGLPADDIWSLFKRCAFGEQDNGSNLSPALQDIGRKIALKLRGSPMLAKAVGQMLEDTRSVTEWRSVLDKNVFDDASALELCYRNLPEHLQPCFAICSIFPKNWRFKRDRLVKIWMALDFIQPTAGVQLEDAGSKYFDELVARSFFHRQKVGRRRYYYIHDLMHDLAEKVSCIDCARVEDAEMEIPGTVRHLSVSSDAVVHLKSRCNNLKKLRTLLILKSPSPSTLNQPPSDLFMELKGLRVLGLECCDNVDVSGIGHLSHLRYLALCKSVTSLPTKVTKLYHLQTLSSPKGSGLKVPEEIVNLKFLRHLDMDTSKVAGIGKLIHLQGSVEFHVNKEKGQTLECLNGMSSLRKELHIKNLHVVTSRQEACKARLNKKENVKIVELEWNSTGKSMPSIDAEVLDGLEPHQHVKKLVIRRYRGSRSPSWLDAGLEHGDLYLKHLYLINCRKWEVLPPLGQLPFLKVLHMKEMCSLKQISCEFYGTYPIAFPCLEELEFSDMPEWVEWTQQAKNSDIVLPNLCKLKLLDCPKLIKVPPLPLSTRSVSVKNAGFASQLKLSSPSTSQVCKFVLDKCSASIFTNGLLHQQQVESIAILTLSNCPDVKFQELHALTSLKRLQISHSSINDEQLSTCLRGLQALHRLEIFDCSSITCLPHIESPDCLTKFRELHIRQCSEFSSLRSLPSFVALEILEIESCSKVTVKSFHDTFNNSSSLREMRIVNCSELESLPSAFPSSLQSLRLIGCKPTLMHQLRVKDGPEWDKVACVLATHIR